MNHQSNKIKLENFEGPLDLLLFLIQKDELDILNIPVANLTDQYLNTLDYNRKELNINISSDFMLMASDLIYLKSKELLPDNKVDMSVQEYEDPKLDLIKQLIEYKKYKDIAGHLQILENFEQKIYPVASKKIKVSKNEKELQIGVLKIIDSFQSALMKIESETKNVIYDDNFTIRGQSNKLIEILNLKNIDVSNFFIEIKNKFELIATFLAILELIKTNFLKIIMSSNSRICISKNS